MSEVRDVREVWIGAGRSAALCLLLSLAAVLAPARVAFADRAVAAAHAASGDSLRAKGDLDGAAAEYRAALEADDDLCQAHFGLSRIALARKEGAAAEKHLSEIEGERCATLYALGMGLIRLEEQRLPDAEIFLLKSAARMDAEPAPIRREIVLALVTLYESKDVPRLGLEHIETVIALSPGDPAPVVRKGRLLVAAKEYDAALAAFREALARDSTHVEAMREIATLYTRAKRPAEAAEWLARIAAAEPSAANDVTAGDALFAAKQFAAARDAYRRAVQADSSLTAARIGLARSAFETGDREEALGAYRSLRDAPGLTAHDHESMGRVLLDQKDYAAARDAYRRALSIDSTLVDAYFYAGYTFLAEKNYRHAIPLFEKRIAADTTSAAAYANLGLCYLQVGDRPRGIEMLERAARLRPDDAQSRTWLAQAYAMQSSWGKAVKEYRAALEIDAQNAEAWRWLGYCLLNQEQPQEAIQALLKADALEPRNAQGLVWLAQGYGLVGQLDKSEATFQKALDIDPGQSDAKAGLEELRRITRKKSKPGTGGGGS